MRIKTGLVALTMMTASCVAVGEASPPAASVPERLAYSERALEKLAMQGFSGSVIIACGKDILVNRDLGNLPQTKQTIRYEVASMAKFLTSIAVLKLVEDGQLQLSDSLSRFYPDMPGSHADITLFQLLTHQSGIRQGYAAEGHADPEAAARAIFSGKLGSKPGQRFGYSNDNFSLLAMIIEKVAGRPYQSYVTDVVMTPLGLSPVRFWSDRQDGDEYLPPLLSPPAIPRGQIDWGFLGGHGARLSVDEIFTILSGLEDGLLLTPKSLELLHTVHVTSSAGTGIAMGWYRRTDKSGRRLAYTSGSDQSGGNAVAYRVDDHGLLIIAATNAGPPEKDGPGWSRRVRDILITDLGREGSRPDVCAARKAD